MLERFRIPIFGAIALAILGGIVALLTYRTPPVVVQIIPPAPTATLVPSATPGPMQIYVSGAVTSPKVYTLPPGSRVQDAINAAGGAAPNADLNRVNLADFLRDGEQVFVPTINSNASASSGSGNSSSNSAEVKTATPSGPVHINTATTDDLQRLPGCGPKLAQEIIDFRAQNGPFKSMADLDKVKGIGAATLAKWDGLIVFD